MVPYTTLFMLTSLDGKISTGVGNQRDIDTDLPMVLDQRILEPYYQNEKRTDYWSCISGQTAYKLGANRGQFIKQFHNCGHIVFDSTTIGNSGLKHIARNCRKMILITDSSKPDRIQLAELRNVSILNVTSTKYVEQIWERLYREYNVREVTLQTGGRINSCLMRKGLIHRVDIHVAPVVIGGFHTPSLCDGDDFSYAFDVSELGVLSNVRCFTYEGGMLRYVADVSNSVDIRADSNPYEI